MYTHVAMFVFHVYFFIKELVPSQVCGPSPLPIWVTPCVQYMHVQLLYSVFSSLGVSEDSGWSKPMEGISTSLLNFRSSDWPVMTSSMPTSSSTSGDLSDGMTTAILPQDNLQTVLDKLGLGDYYHIFQVSSFMGNLKLWFNVKF